MTYKLYQVNGQLVAGISRIDLDGSISFVPDEPENRDWQAYQEWLAAGNTPEPAE